MNLDRRNSLRGPGVLEVTARLYDVRHGRDEPHQKIGNNASKGVLKFLRIVAWENDALEFFAAKSSFFVPVVLSMPVGMFRNLALGMCRVLAIEMV